MTYPSFDATPSGLHLPTRLAQRGAEQPAQREKEWLSVGPWGADVKVRAVDMGRQGWRHEVQVEWLERDNATGRGTVKRDVLWLVGFDRAHELAERAVDRLREPRFDTLGQLAAEHSIPLD